VEELAGEAYENSDYSLPIAVHVVNWLKRIIIVQKLTLVELWAVLSPRCPPSLKRTIQLSSVVQLSGKAHKDSVHIVVIAVVHWCLRAATMFCLRFDRHGSINSQRGHHMICALVGTSRKLAAYNYASSLALWTMLEYKLLDANGVCQSIQKFRVEPATRSAVANW